MIGMIKTNYGPSYRYVRPVNGFLDVVSSAWSGVTNVAGQYVKGQQAVGYQQAVESGKAVSALDTKNIITIAGVAIGGIVLVSLLAKKK